jgi:site-specific DNA-methyltransferase (adenine-specific)
MSKTNEWATPSDLFDELNREFNFTLDPCSTKDNAKCQKFYTKQDDGLSKSWAGERVFMNPPYGREIGHWIRKAYLETSALVVCLIPSRTDTKYWHEYCMKANEIRFVEGRIRFGIGLAPAPFPSCIVVFQAGRPNNSLQRTTGMHPLISLSTPEILSASVVGTPSRR